jgi:hypothetical protein
MIVEGDLASAGAARMDIAFVSDGLQRLTELVLI